MTLSGMFAREPKEKADLRFSTEVFEMFLERGVDVNTQNNSGETALMAACMGYYLPVVEWLLQHGTNVDVNLNFLKKVTKYIIR